MLNPRSRKTYLVLFCIYLAAVAVACFTKPSNLPDMGAGTLLRQETLGSLDVCR